MKTELTSKERILATLQRKPTDHLPMCFNGMCHGYTQFVKNLFEDPYKRTSFFLDLGVDTAMNISIDWKGPNHTVEVREWTEKHDDEDWLIKEYGTVKGKLRQTVRKNEEYPHDSIPLFDDFNVPPGRSVKYLVDKEEELDRLECLLNSPDDTVADGIYEFAAEAKKFCNKNGIMLVGNLPGVGDPMMWLSGVENILIAAMDEPNFLHKYADIISKIDQKHLEILLNAGVDMILRRGWYESTDFWSPQLYREFLFNPLKREIETAHQAGAKYSYIMNSGATLLANQFKECNLDILANLEPDKNDIVRIKKEIGSQVTLSGGVNNYTIIEKGTEDDVEKAVKVAVELYSPNGGFILAPSDSILDTSETAQRNFYKMIAIWKEIA